MSLKEQVECALKVFDDECLVCRGKLKDHKAADRKKCLEKYINELYDEGHACLEEAEDLEYLLKKMR